MEVEVLADAAAVAERAGAWLAERLAATVARRGSVSLAVSGGATPVEMFTVLSGLDVPWEHVTLFQVDERVAPDGHADRNATSLRSALLDRVPIPAANVHLMPVTLGDLDTAARRYADLLPARLDVVHLGIGDDGHTASWPPGHAVLQVRDRDVAVLGPYHGRLRMTLTPPAVNRAIAILWQISGESKAPAVARLLSGDRTLPAAHVRTTGAVLITDRFAARGRPSGRSVGRRMA